MVGVIMSDRVGNYFRQINKSTASAKKQKTVSLFGTISSILTGGKQANVKTTSQSENRDVDIMLPYGFASFGFKGMKAHILGTGKHKSIVGIFDIKRPKTKHGEVIIYTRDGTQIKLDNKGHVLIKGDVSINGSLKVNGRDI